MPFASNNPSPSRPDTSGHPRFECVLLTASRTEFETFSALAAQSGIRVHHAGRLKQADALLAETQALVLITDQRFTEGTWKQAGELIQSAHPLVSLVLVMDNSDESFWIDALEQGAYDVLVRPFFAEELRRVLENASEHSRWARYVPRRRTAGSA
jgi:DNA-binding NtrC family response regulator